ncbi:MAG: SDR family oxidoreductase [Acidimicrobiales bacterium]
MRGPIALVTGVGREVGLGFAIAERLADDGFDVATTYWSAYDERMSHGADAHINQSVAARLSSAGAKNLSLEVDFEDPSSIAKVFDRVEADLGSVSALVLCHCESVNSGILDTSIESFDRHFAVNARACWLLVKEFAQRFVGETDSGRIVALTSDHTVGNLPYGASKGALDRIVLAAAQEFAGRGISANVVNPGPVQTGWMSDDLIEVVEKSTALGRVGRPSDVANLVSFLCSSEGGWVNGQLLHSNGGLRPL